MSLGPRAIILRDWIISFLKGHWPVLLDILMGVLSWVIGVSRIGFWAWVPAVPPAYLLGRLFWERRGRTIFLAKSPGAK